MHGTVEWLPGALLYSYPYCIACTGEQDGRGAALWHARHCGVAARITTSCFIHIRILLHVQENKPDVVLHFGMHGTVEWLPCTPLGT